MFPIAWLFAKFVPNRWLNLACVPPGPFRSISKLRSHLWLHSMLLSDWPLVHSANQNDSHFEMEVLPWFLKLYSLFHLLQWRLVPFWERRNPPVSFVPSCIDWSHSAVNPVSLMWWKCLRSVLFGKCQINKSLSRCLLNSFTNSMRLPHKCLQL